MLAASLGQAQVSVATNNSNAGDYVGCDNTSPFPLEIRQNDNQPIEWYTDAIARMRMNPTVSTGVNSFASAPRNGFVLLSGQPDAFTNGSSYAPFTRLHLVDDAGSSVSPIVYAQALGYRPWQRNGITFTGNSDQSYIGHKYSGNDNTDFVIQWSDNPQTQPWGCDRMKFVFSSSYTAAGSGMGSLDGMEAMRLWPKSGTEVNVGVGNFAPAGTGDPTERLDVLDGRVRIRQLPDDAEVDDLFKVMVVDDTSDPLERGVVKWLDASALGGDCDWENNGIDDIVTAWQPAPITGCPGETNMVGIGLFEPQAKLDVYKNYDNGFGTEIGIRSHMDFTAASKVAVEVINVQEASENFGLRSVVDGAERNWGVVSLTGAHDQGGTTVAGYFHADGEYVITDPIAVWGVATNNPSGGPGWAAWLDGKGYISSGPWVPSDADLKQNVEDLDDCLTVVDQLAPKSYLYNTQDHPGLNLPQGYQAGIMAQELAVVLPHLVQPAHRPAITDSSGNEVFPAQDLMTVNYQGLIPYLIGAVQELKSDKDALQDQVTAMQQDLAACCTNDGSGDQRSMSSGAGGMKAAHTDLFIIPNPVADLTQLRYTIATPGRTRLEIADSQGKRIEVLEEAVRDNGTFEYGWNTQGLAPGTYHCTLYLNDTFVVKKAVKVAR